MISAYIIHHFTTYMHWIMYSTVQALNNVLNVAIGESHLDQVACEFLSRPNLARLLVVAPRPNLARLANDEFGALCTLSAEGRTRGSCHFPSSTGPRQPGPVP